MFVIQETTAEPSLADVKFACDLARCKGACCTLPGGAGAPLLDEEVGEIERAYAAVKPMLNADHRAIVERTGFVEGSAGHYNTPCFDNRACVYVTFEDGIAKCSFEKAFQQGISTFRKPLSCHLFPIRVDRGPKPHLRFEFIPECVPALTRGGKENIYLSDFLKSSLLRTYGQSWYNEFLSLCDFERSKSGILQQDRRSHD